MQIIDSSNFSRSKNYFQFHEVWFWQNNRFEVYCLGEVEYEQVPRSELLPALDLTLLAKYIVKSDPLEAVLQFREKVRESAG